MPVRGGLNLSSDRLCPLLHRRLAGTQRRPTVASVKRVGDPKLTRGECRGLRERMVQRIESLLTPGPRDSVPVRAQLIGDSRESRFRDRALAYRLSPVSRSCRAEHRALRFYGSGVRSRKRRAATRRGFGPGEVALHIGDPAREGIGTHCKLSLTFRGRRVRPRRVHPVPLGLPPTEVFRVGGEGFERAFSRRAPQQRPTPVQYLAQLSLGLGQTLERVARCFGVESRQRLLEFAQPLRQLGGERPL